MSYRLRVDLNEGNKLNNTRMNNTGPVESRDLEEGEVDPHTIEMQGLANRVQISSFAYFVFDF